MSVPVYLDCNATAPIRPEAADAVARALAIGGNPSSIHARGRAARAAVEEARDQVAALVGAAAADIVFTSGGTEANALAIDSAVASGAAKRLIVGATEHESVVETARATGLPVETWPVDGQGRADLAWLQARLAAWGPAEGRPFVALMLANNETGVIQPVAEAAALVHAAGGALHVDAIQAAGKIAVDLGSLGADTLALSAHKLGGPAGVGALAFTPAAAIHRQMHGGGQERGLRAGTENLCGIAGFGAAAAAGLCDLDAFAAQGAWRDATIDRLKAETGVAVAGEGAPRLPNTLCLAVQGYASSLQVMALDLDGVMVSAGSACSSGKVRQSAVLATMGMGELAQGSLRASGGWATTEQDWRRFADAWLAAFKRHGSRVGAKEYA
ncbi:MAG TPA: aminotransferase class V-fold PLP-dependent enzyme [Caulobacteraceae bacterium]|jgi:cysteine desulfurase|nr:aminotransferase class V-fold PLP-dependent enzyme [Caulobacteraceae bacterium]